MYIANLEHIYIGYSPETDIEERTFLKSFFVVVVGYIIWWSGSCLPCRRSVLLSVSSGVVWFCA